MKRFFISLLLCLLFTVGASAASVDALYIDCTLRSDGSVTYSVAVSARFDAMEKKFVIPLAGEGISGVSSSGKWSLLTSDGWTRIELRNDDGFIGRQTFVVNYRTAALENRSSERDELTLPLVGSRWEVDAAEFSFTVTVPAALETEPTLVSGYSGELLDAVTLTATGFSGVLESGLMAHEALSAELHLPEGYFGDARLRNFRTLDWGLVLLAALMLLAVLYWLRHLRSRKPVVQSRVLPPEGWTPAELPMILDGSMPDATTLLPMWGQLGYLYVDHAGGELVLGQGMAMGSERPTHEGRMFASLFQGRREFWMPDRRFRQAAAQTANAAERVWRARLFDREGGNPQFLRILAALTAGMANAAVLSEVLPQGVGWALLTILSFVPGVVLGLLGQLTISELRRRPVPQWKLLPGAGALLLLLLMATVRALYALPALAMQIFSGWQLAYGGRRSTVGVETLGQLLSLRRFLLQASPKRLQQVLRRDPGWLQSVLPYAEQLGLSRHLARTLGETRIEEPAWLRTDESLTTVSACCAAYQRLMLELRGEKKTGETAK